MKNKKGFTLIELLAVIVILAIIAVITVPKIADMITSSRQGGAEDSFYGALKAAELGYTKALQSNTNLKGSTCTIEDSKINCTNGVKIDVSGKTPESGTLVIDSAGSTIAKALTLNGYKCYGDLSTENPCVKADVEVASEALIKKVTTSGDGLYKDSYKDGRYVFKGQTPNNYIMINGGESWRIVAVEMDGTLKIIRNNSIANMAFDSKTTDTTGPRLNSSNTYCTIYTDGKYHGCNAWNAVSGIFINNDYKGTVTQDSELKKYLNGEYYKSLSKTTQNLIESHDFKKGGIIFGSSLKDATISEDKDIWNGNIALLSLSDWYKASNNVGCTETTNDWYGTGKGDIHDNYKCSVDNYLYKDGNWWWLLNPNAEGSISVANISNIGSINRNGAYNTNRQVYPVLYLKANLQLTGTGTQSDPYKIVT